MVKLANDSESYKYPVALSPDPSCSRVGKHYPVDSMVCFVKSSLLDLCLIMIYLMDSFIHTLNNWALEIQPCPNRQLGGEA